MGEGGRKGGREGGMKEGRGEGRRKFLPVAGRKGVARQATATPPSPIIRGPGDDNIYHNNRR